MGKLQHGEGGDTTETVSVAQEEVFQISKSQINKAKKKAKKKRLRDNELRERKKVKKEDDRFPGKAPVDEEALARHDRGAGVDAKRVKTKFGQKMAKRREEAAASVEETAARAEILLDSEAGYLECGGPDDDEEFTARVTQSRIKKEVDVASASKGFDLNLRQFGPYTIDYSRHGRCLLLGGRKGHVAAMDWLEKRLLCEINVQDSVHDVKWLHTENMFAVAQNRWTYIYDNQGIELHCLKRLDQVLRLEFLPYHFLLASGNERGFLSWLDISVGSLVSQFNTRMGRLSIMAQNPANAVICLGHSKGVVTMWTPTVKDEAVMKILAHRQPLTSLAVERSGTYMATAAMDRTVRVWDLRNGQRCLKEFVMPYAAAGSLKFSDRKMLGTVVGGDTVEFYRDVCTSGAAVEYPYMRHKVHRKVTDLKFVPFEDVVGVGHADGFSSLLVPGCGEANFDSLEANPYQSKRQRREAEVKSLLEKIPADLITLNPDQIAEIDTETLEDKLAARHQKKSLKPAKIDFEPRPKTKGKGGTAKKFHIKRTVVDEERRRQIRELASGTNLESREGKQSKKKEKNKNQDLLARLG